MTWQLGFWLIVGLDLAYVAYRWRVSRLSHGETICRQCPLARTDAQHVISKAAVCAAIDQTRRELPVTTA